MNVPLLKRRRIGSDGVHAQDEKNLTSVLNEAEIRVFLALKLCHAGIEFSCERLIPNSNKRYDIGVHYEEKLVALIEVKCEQGILEINNNRKGYEVNQREAYISSGLPWRYCSGYIEIYETQRWVKNILKALGSDGKSPEVNPLQKVKKQQQFREDSPYRPKRKRVIVVNLSGEVVHPNQLFDKKL